MSGFEGVHFCSLFFLMRKMIHGHVMSSRGQFASEKVPGDVFDVFFAGFSDIFVGL